MIAVVQRVSEAGVSVEATGYDASIGAGFMVLLGVEDGDTEDAAAWMAGKIARLRIMSDDEGKMNRSVQDTAGSILLVSQFTLAGDCAKGNRPSFVHAAEPGLGERLYEQVAARLRDEHGVPTETGEFGAMMRVRLVNEGPVTLLLRSPGS